MITPQERKCFIFDTIAANIDNQKLNAVEFREFVRNSLKALTLQDSQGPPIRRILESAKPNTHPIPPI